MMPMMNVASQPPPSSPRIRQLRQWLRSLPIVQFYAYLFQRSPLLFTASLGTNYLLPILLELLPWYLSPRQLSKLLRDSRNAIQHRLIANDPLKSQSLIAFLALSVLYTALQTVEEHLRNRVLYSTRLVIRRLIVEKLLFSDIGAFQRQYQRSFSVSSSVASQSLLRTEAIETHVFNDINDTLTLFQSTIPATLQTAYEFGLSLRDLYRQRESIDALSIIRPSIVGFLNEAVNLCHDAYVKQPLLVRQQQSNYDSQRLLSNIMAGMCEIQVNNLQCHQLHSLDALNDSETSHRLGVVPFLDSWYQSWQSRSVLDFISEVAIVRLVMQRNQLTHEQYQQLRLDIEYTARQCGRLYSLVKDGHRVVDTQQRVMTVLNLPTFGEESEVAAIREKRRQSSSSSGKAYQRVRFAIDTDHDQDFDNDDNDSDTLTTTAITEADFHFQSLTINKLFFRYDDDEPYALQIDEPLSFHRGLTYAVVGANRSGKSTLVQLLCRLYHPAESDSDIVVNDWQSFYGIDRLVWRNQLSYIAQSPFIFPGTIEDNIRSGLDTVSATDIKDAAKLAGVFMTDASQSVSLNGPVTGSVSDGAEWVSRSVSASTKPWERNSLNGLIKRLWHRFTSLVQSIEHSWADEDREFEELFEHSEGVDSIRTGEALTQSSSYDNALLSPVSPPVMNATLSMEVLERGSNLSGGFAQSISLARVFLHRSASIVILDEAMSAMDTAKKRQLIYPALFDYVRQHGMTLIVISHDLPSVTERVDCVYVMETGRVIDRGSHAELMARKSPSYRRLIGLSGSEGDAGS